jgi:CHAT domain-containing protein/tetratricopeptide (TPR) repeat protein
LVSLLGAATLAAPGTSAFALTWTSAKDRRLKEIDTLRLRAFRAYKARDFAEASKWQQKALDLQREVLGREAPECATSLGNLALFAQLSGDLAAARKHYEEALGLRRKVLGKQHADTARNLRDLVTVLTQQGDRKGALPLQEEAARMFAATLGEEHAESMQALDGLASTRAVLGDAGTAVADRERLLRLCRKVHGKDSRVVAGELVKLAQARGAVGKLDAGCACLDEALRIYRRRPSDKDLERAACLALLGSFHLALGRDDRARQCHEEAYRIRKSALGESALPTLDSLADLAAVLQKQGKVNEARRHLEKVVAAYRRKHGAHPLTAHRLLALGRLLTGEDAKTAGKLLDEALRIWKSNGDDSWGYERAQTLAAMARVAAGQGQWQRAARHMDESRRLVRPFLARALGGLGEAEQMGYLTLADRLTFRQALSLGLSRPKELLVAEKSAGWLLNGKAVAQESLASAVVLSSRSDDVAVGKLSEQLLTVRQLLAKLTVWSPGAGQEKEHRQLLAQLTAREQELGKKLRQMGSKAAAPAWVELDQVRQALPAGAVLIDLARFESFDFKAGAGKNKWQPPRYAAWITPKKGPVQLIDLGAASKIDRAVGEVREELQGTLKRIGEGEEKTENLLRKRLESLSKLVLAPLLPQVGKAERWLISPDGNLWLVPWEMLLENGGYAIEKHTISYLTSGRDLVSPFAKVKSSAPLVLADPDFDLDPNKAKAEAARLLGGGAGTRSLSGALRLGKVPRLPGAAAEAKAITPSLKVYAGVTPRVFTRGQALEGVFKAARNPRVLVLCTHGFFLPDPQTLGDKDSLLGSIGTKAPARWQNPLLRCGLLLAGCNKAAKASDGDDGVLTGLEVVGTDLRGCELVVLSACETGLGSVQIGEGVAGLRQAFQLAGAQAVVATLWQVPDEQSARLMTLFFRNLAKKMGKAEALVAAKRQIIKERRDDYAAAHPFFWAAFTLTGES